MCILFLLVFLVYSFADNSRHDNGGRTICALFFGPTVFLTLVSCAKWEEHDPGSKGVGWIFIVGLLLSVGFGAAAFGRN